MAVLSCKKNGVSGTPVTSGDTAVASLDAGKTYPFMAPMYWSPYELHIVKEGSGVQDNYISEDAFKANIDWVETNLKPYGVNMICMDGWGDVNLLNENGYRKSHSSHWAHDYAYWSNYLQQKGMTLGMYNNPLWVHVNNDDKTTLIKGTNIPVSTLKNPSENALWFQWVQVNRPGAEQYIKGYVQYYADMGIKYLRIDFLAWFETGYDRNLGKVGPERPHSDYIKALRWIRQACDANDIFLSLVMPNLNNEAEVENVYGHMIRINDDAGDGKWWKWSDAARGQRRAGWSQYANAMDGLTYWSSISGRGKMILDPDFLRINTFTNDDEKKSVVSACLMAGAPVTVADQYNTIGSNIWVYQNQEMMDLNKDRFVGKPLTNDPTKQESQIWKGQMQNGDWVVGLFNRESSATDRTINFADLAITGKANVRDMWKHEDLGSKSSYTAKVPAHGCVIIKLVK